MQNLNKGKKHNSFSAEIFKIGINPYVLVPQEVLEELFSKALFAGRSI